VLNEKTLELNITGEMLRLSQRFDKRAFAFGITLRQEGHYGYDSRVLGRFPYWWKASVLQYKRAKKSYLTRLNQTVYVFEINDNTNKDQHKLLCKIAGNRQNVALYVLPCYVTLFDLRNSMPNPLSSTYFADATQIPIQAVGSQKHELHVYPANLYGILRSKKDEMKIRIMSPEKFRSLLFEKRIGMPIGEIVENLSRSQKEEERTYTKRPRFLFSVFSVDKERSKERESVIFTKRMGAV